MIDERRAPLVQTVFSFVNGGVEIFAHVRADQIGKDFVKEAAQQCGRRRARATPPTGGTVNLRANFADLQSYRHYKIPLLNGTYRTHRAYRSYEPYKSYESVTNLNNTAGGSPSAPTRSECVCAQASTSSTFLPSSAAASATDTMCCLPSNSAISS